MVMKWEALWGFYSSCVKKCLHGIERKALECQLKVYVEFVQDLAAILNAVLAALRIKPNYQ